MFQQYFKLCYLCITIFLIGCNGYDEVPFAESTPPSDGAVKLKTDTGTIATSDEYIVGKTFTLDGEITVQKRNKTQETIELKWTSSDTEVATVMQVGANTTPTEARARRVGEKKWQVIPKKPGMVTITGAYSYDNAGKQESGQIKKDFSFKAVITFDSQGGNDVASITVTSSTQQVTEPDPNPTKQGFTFVNWYTEETGGKVVIFPLKDITTNRTLYARWSTSTFTVTYNGNKPTNAPTAASVNNLPTPNPVTVNYNGTTTKPTTVPTLTGYAFGGWYTEVATTNMFNFQTTIMENKTLYAKWLKQLTVTFHANKPSAASQSATVENLPSTNPVTVDTGKTVMEPATEPTLTGYTFAGWYTEAATTNMFNFNSQITENKNLYVKWTNASTILVRYATHGGSPVESTTITSDSQTVARPTTDPTREHYTFGGWFDAATAGNTVTFPITGITASRTIHAQWTRITYTVTYNANLPSGVTDTPTGIPASPTTVNSGEPTTTPTTAPTLTGYTFGGWYTEEATTNMFNFQTTITENKTLYAKWNIIQYRITYHANAPLGTTATGIPTPQNVNTGSMATEPTAPTLTGYNFDGWYTEVTTTNMFSFSTTITENKDLYAKWSRSTAAVKTRTAVLPGTTYGITGTITLEEQPDGTIKLKIETDFKSGGPDPYLYLGTSRSVSSGSSIEVLNREQLTNIQLPYETTLPSSVTSIDQYSYVVIYCKRFGTTLSSAAFSN